jgi:hypothetical protein
VGKSQSVDRLGAVIGRWGVAAIWVTLPFSAGPTLADALHTTEPTFRTTSSVLAWVIWCVVLAMTLVPRTVTLTAIRLVVPATPVAVGWAVVTVDEPGWAEVLALTAAVLATVLVLAPQTADRFIDGSSYGVERRMALRAPGPLLLGPVELAWAVAVVGIAAGPLLLADRSWVAGALAIVIGWPIAGLAVRALHGLALRWWVFTEAGIVIVDRYTLSDTLLASRRALRSIGPAPVGTTGLDLTANALGLALELRFGNEQVVTPSPRSRVRGTRPESVATTAVVVAPSLPGLALREARRRRLPVQQAMPPPTTSSPA